MRPTATLEISGRGATAPPVATAPPRPVAIASPGQQRGVSANRFVLGWAAAWGLVGALTATAIMYLAAATNLVPLMLTSVLFAEVVGFTALLSARLVFPFFTQRSAPTRLGLQIMTLFTGTVAGSIAVLAAQPLWSLANMRLLSVIVLVNAMLAVLTGLALFTYDTMRRQIEGSFLALREKERLENELAIARDVQHELLPRTMPVVHGLDVTGRCLPAVGVGGDYFDFLPLSEDRLGLVIADVSGKGIPAALLMAGLQASVRSVALPGLPPSEVNRCVNVTLHDSTSAARYATMFFALWDGRAGTLAYSNAGHFPPILLRGASSTRLAVGGLPIGMFPAATYTEEIRQLQHGDLLVLFTDGVIEAPDADGNEFGEERLIDILRRHHDYPLDNLLDRVVEAVARWKGEGPPHDDVTLVVARVR